MAIIDSKNNISLREITKDNFDACIALEITEDQNQKKFVSSNLKSLAEAWVFYEYAHPFTI